MKFIADISDHSWIIENQSSMPQKNLFFGFINAENSYVEFDDLRFGVTIYLNEEIVFKDSLPRIGSSYISSDQEYVDWFDVNVLSLGTEYAAKVWAENAGIFWEADFSFILPVEKQPFPSWVYDHENETWKAPVDMPDGEGIYSWSEDNQVWVELP